MKRDESISIASKKYNMERARQKKKEGI